MRAGQLRQRITVYEKTVTGQDTYGKPTFTWAEIGAFWCSILALTGRELDSMQQRFAEARYKITLRKQPNITFRRAMRVVWGSRDPLDILDVQDTGGIRPEVVIYAKDYEG